MTTTRIEFCGEAAPHQDEILTPAALDFITRLHDVFGGRRIERLAERRIRLDDIARGRDPEFPFETRAVREDPSWQVAGSAPGLEDRRVEITGPASDRKMTVNALNSGARVWLADAEDASSPTWANVVAVQTNLYDAIRRRVDFTSAEGKEYRVGDTTPTIVFRPRGWHLPEKHLKYVERPGRRVPASGSLVDFGLYVFHNASELIARGTGPYFYLPKIENRTEARLWDDVFTFTENALGLAHGTIRATVLIETITAAFEMEEILYELREHCAGLNAGRWDYIFSIIKNFRDRGPDFVLPDRAQVTMTVPFMRAYTELLVATCHRRGAFAIGGMSAFIPSRRDPAVNERALAQVGADKAREADDGFDGSWVAHPDLVPVAQAEFDRVLGERPNQVDRQREDVHVEGGELIELPIPGATITDTGVRTNVSVGLRYLESWLRGNGAVAIDNLMEDAATAEISRSQLWQWIRHGVVTAEGTPVTAELVDEVLEDLLAELPASDDDRFEAAAEILREIVYDNVFQTFLTTGAYASHLVSDAAVTGALQLAG
ncbi:malate synthase A [Gryllotalpicola reticulitermitis]|uniref:Malate synthase n=1 Tax=Gryllotalpicola reticulitermitis TaxID=1184153 RepID=A0ABV8Q436_9MICO